MEHEIVTLREIYAQPDVWRKSLTVLEALPVEALAGDRRPQEYEWILVGCGTSYYLAQAAAATFTAHFGIPVRAVPASEILLSSKLVFPGGTERVFPVLISRSGTTSEVLKVAEFFRARGVEFLAVTCDGNDLAGLTERVVAMPAHEQSTVMTSSFTSMLLALQYISAKLAGERSFLESLSQLPGALEWLLERYGSLVRAFAQQSLDDVAFLAQGALYPIASETSLKVMESSSSFAQYFHTLEFRHGPKSIVQEGVLVGTLISEASYEEESAVLLEMKELGACTLAIANRFTPEVRNAVDLAIELNLNVPELARMVIYVVWGQLFGSCLGLHKGLNPDSPRHLSRVVMLAG